MASVKAETVDAQEAQRRIAGGEAIAVDVRTEEKFMEGHPAGAINLPGADPEAGSKQPEDGAELIVIAESGKQAKEAASKLSDAGFEAIALDGDMDDWLGEDFKVQPSRDPDGDTELGRR